jgi:hypothetical protein
MARDDCLLNEDQTPGIEPHAEILQARLRTETHAFPHIFVGFFLSAPGASASRFKKGLLNEGAIPVLWTMSFVVFGDCIVAGVGSGTRGMQFGHGG